MAAVALEIVEMVLLLQQELQIQAAEAEAVEIRGQRAALAWSSFVMQILLRRQPQPQVLYQLL
jgi:hypothetical protein